MSYVQVDAQSGSFTNDSGQTVTFTTVSNKTYNVYPSAIDGISGPWIGNGNEGNETHTHTFSQAVSGVQFEFTVLNNTPGTTAEDANEEISFVIDGNPVDLNAMIASGDATFSTTGGPAVITADGNLGTTRVVNYGKGVLTFKVPIETLIVEQTVLGGGPNGTIYALSADTAPVSTPEPDIVGTPPASDGNPSVSLSEAIFLGNFTDADPNEGFPPSINTAPYLGTFGSPANPLWQDEVLVTYNDVNGDNTINTDNFAGIAQFQEEQISYDIGIGTQNAEIDSIASVNVTVTYTDGSTQSYTNALMYQDTNGNMFLVNSDFAGTDLNSPSGVAIQSIDVTSVLDDHDGFTQDDFQPFVCFTSGTRIATVSGDRLIEDLVAGDLVLTMDRSYQPIRWIGSTKVPATGDLAPILIRKGALGNDRDLLVSPQHRMLLQGWHAEMLFGEQEVLATAKSLVNDHSILRDEGGEVEYFHMLFDTHEIIWAEGTPSESFHPGEQGWKALDQGTRDEILTLFPELSDGNFNTYGASARTSLKHNEGQLLGAYLAGLS